jgi:GxxExxY protein
VNTDKHRFFPHKELGYKLRGIFFEIRNRYGVGHKELVYKNLILEKLKERGLSFVVEKAIKIYSLDTGKPVGVYVPDIIIEDVIVVEIKSTRFTSRQDEKQLYYYLRSSKYEVGYLVNFSTPELYIKRIIYTNDRKPFLRKSV